MAEVIKEVVSFDLDTKNAVATTNNLVSELKRLEQELAVLQKEGKDTAQVQAQITAASQKLNAQLGQTTTTVKGQAAQVQALNNANNNLSKTTNQVAQTQNNLAKASKTAATSVARSAGNIKSFGGAVALGAANLGNFLGIANLGSFAVGALTTVVDKAVVAFTEWLSPQDKVLEKSKELATAFATEALESKALFDAASLATEGTKDRAAAINAINEEYGKYLPNLLTEKSTNEEIAAAYQTVNNAILQNILVKAKAEEQTNLFTKLLQNQLELAKQEREEGFFGTVTTQALKANIEATKKEISNLDATFASVESNLQGLDLNIETTNVQTELKRTNAELQALDGLLKAGLITQKDYDAILEKLNKRIDGLNALQRAANKETDKATKKTKEAKTEYQVLKGSLSDLESELSRIQKLLSEQVKADDLENIKILTDEYNRLALQLETAKQAIEALKPKPIKLIDIQEIDVLKNAQIEVERLTIAQTNSIEQLETERGKALQQAANDAKTQLAINEQFDKRRLQLEQETDRKILQARLRVLQLQKTAAQIAGEETAKIEADIAAINLQITELNNKSITIDANVEPAKDKINKVRETVLAVIDGLQNLSNQVEDFLTQNTQRVIAQLDTAIQNQKDALATLLNNQSTANAKQVQAEQARLDALEKARQRAKEREAAIIIAQIAANSALTIARAAAEGGGIASAFTIAAALASLTFGFASARAQAEQSFYDGTTFLDDPSAPRGRDTIRINANRGEAIIPTATNAKYKTAVEAIYHQSVPAQAINDFVSNYGKPIAGLNDYIGFAPLPMLAGFGVGDTKQIEKYLKAILEKQTDSTVVVNVKGDGTADVTRRKNKF